MFVLLLFSLGFFSSSFGLAVFLLLFVILLFFRRSSSGLFLFKRGVNVREAAFKNDGNQPDTRGNEASRSRCTNLVDVSLLVEFTVAVLLRVESEAENPGQDGDNKSEDGHAEESVSDLAGDEVGLEETDDGENSEDTRPNGAPNDEGAIGLNNVEAFDTATDVVESEFLAGGVTAAGGSGAGFPVGELTLLTALLVGDPRSASSSSEENGGNDVEDSKDNSFNETHFCFVFDFV